MRSTRRPGVRVPLPRQTGGAHRTRKGEPERKAKYRTDYRRGE